MAAEDRTIPSSLPQPSAIDAIARIAAPEAEMLLVTVPDSLQGVPSEVPLLFDAKAQKPVSLKAIIEEFRSAPERRKGTASVTTLQSFIDLVNYHKDGSSALFGLTDPANPSLQAVIDYHTTNGEPRYGEHRIVYTFPLTPEFKAWMAQDGKAMEQADFAAFLEEHAAELAAPQDGERSEFEPLFKERFATPIELISLSRSLEVFVGQKVKRQERLQTGERTIEFTAEHTDHKGEKIDIPGIFMVSIQAFLDGAPIRIPARLRYRLKGGEISWFYQLYRADFWLRDEVVQSLTTAAKQTSLPAFEGSPER